MRPGRTALLLAIALPALAQAQRVERFSLSGQRVAVGNLVGNVRIEAGSGRDVVVEVTRNGADGGRITIDERTVDGRAAVCISFPDDRIVYRPDRQDSRSRSGSYSTTSSSAGCDRGSGSWLRGGRRIEVRSSGSGLEAWADVRILVPRGSDLTLWHTVGDVEVSGVDATLDIDVASAGVATRDTRGDLTVDTGSGHVTVAGHTGPVSVDVGSGGVELSDVNGESVNIDSGSGTLRGTNISTDDLLLDTGSGSIEFTGVRARVVRIDTGSGSARLGLVSRVDDLDIDTGSGGVTVSLPSDFGATVQIESGSGGITSDFPVQTRSSGRHMLRGTIGDGRGRLTIETGSGRVRLERGSGASRNDERNDVRRNDVRRDVREDVRRDVHEDIRRSVREDVRRDIREDIRRDIHDDIRLEIRDVSHRESIGRSVGDSVRDAVRDMVRDIVRETRRYGRNEQ